MKKYFRYKSEKYLRCKIVKIFHFQSRVTSECNCEFESRPRSLWSNEGITHKETGITDKNVHILTHYPIQQLIYICSRRFDFENPLSLVMCLNDPISFLGDVNARNSLV